VTKVCNEIGVEFTRYSDDLTFSSTQKNLLGNVESEVRRIVRGSVYPRLELNEDKRVSVARNTAFRVTGLTLTNQGLVSVGRARKRGVRSGVDSFVKGMLDSDEVRKLKGEVAFVVSIEPSYWQVLFATYGDACISVLPRRKDS